MKIEEILEQMNVDVSTCSQQMAIVLSVMLPVFDKEIQKLQGELAEQMKLAEQMRRVIELRMSVLADRMKREGLEGAPEGPLN